VTVLSPEWSSLALFVLAALVFVRLGMVTDGLYAVGTGTARQWLRANPRYLAGQRWVSGGAYVGLGVGAALSSGKAK
jgi:threonine/homoserine/homoserine lactone efflux protein